MRPRAAVFFDKDGTLIEDIPYNVDPARIRLAPGAAEALPRLADAGYRLIVVSNQSGIARGLFDERALAPVEERLSALIGDAGANLDGFYYCPHLAGGQVARYAFACGCRKPAPGLIRTAADDLSIDLSASWLVGDILDDIEAGRAAGCRTILLGESHETQWRLSQRRLPHHIVRGLAEAAAVVLAIDAAHSVPPALAGAAP